MTSLLEKYKKHVEDSHELTKDILETLENVDEELYQIHRRSLRTFKDKLDCHITILKTGKVVEDARTLPGLEFARELFMKYFESALDDTDPRSIRERLETLFSAIDESMINPEQIDKLY